jgi:hypothetical protein
MLDPPHAFITKVVFITNWVNITTAKYIANRTFDSCLNISISLSLENALMDTDIFPTVGTT